MKMIVIAIAAIAVAIVPACAPRDEIEMPDRGSEGIGFDDMQFSPARGVMVPGGRTGHVDLIDPATHAVRAVGSLSTSPTYEGGHDTGVTTVADTGRWLVAMDRDTQMVHVFDPDSGDDVVAAHLGHPADYVRWIDGPGEIWVTEPSAAVIEVFRLAGAPAPTLTRIAEIAIAGGPESLVIDDAHGRAYTNSFGPTTYAVDIATHAIAATWPNSCASSRGIDADRALGLVFAQCTEGKVVAIRADTGEIVGSVWPSDHVDVIAYSPRLRHLYLPSGIDAHVAIVGVSSTGELATLGSLHGALLGFCATTDDDGGIYVCDPRHGSVIALDDPYAAITR